MPMLLALPEADDDLIEAESPETAIPASRFPAATTFETAILSAGEAETTQTPSPKLRRTPFLTVTWSKPPESSIP